MHVVAMSASPTAERIRILARATCARRSGTRYHRYVVRRHLERTRFTATTVRLPDRKIVDHR